MQGRVVTQELVDALTIQSLFNPHILDFWRVIMANDTNEDDNVHGPQMQGKLDKLEIPVGFVGNFQDLFELLLFSFGTIAIALHRYCDNLPSLHQANVLDTLRLQNSLAM